MRVPFSYLTEQFAKPEPIFQSIKEFLKRCDFTLGEDVAEFEKRFASFCGAKHAIGVGTGTDALFLSLKALGIGAGDEVITAPNSFIATTGAIVQAGARPVYADVTDDLTLDCEKVAAAVTDRTRAILPVHWAGYPADMERLLEVGARYHIPVVEDACQALGARIDGRHVGTLGVAGAFSVHPLKPLHVWGDGGLVITNSDELARELRLLRNHGLEGRDLVRCYGYNSRLDNLQAIVGLHGMQTLASSVEARQKHAAIYDKAFATKGRGRVELPPRDPKRMHSFHLYQILVEDRDGLERHLKGQGIEAKVHYPTPLHLQPAAQAWGYTKGKFPKTEQQSEKSLTLPCHQFLSVEQVEFTAKRVLEYVGA